MKLKKIISTKNSLTSDKRGFTLIELLVVISIIALLSSIVFSSLNSARLKARDARRSADITQIATAIQFYYDSNGTFPACGGTYWCCLGHSDTQRCWNGDYPGNPALNNALAPYISQLPDDPLNNTSKYGDAYMYALEASVPPYALLHWGVENANPTNKDCAGGIVGGQWPAGTGSSAAGFYCLLYIH